MTARRVFSTRGEEGAYNPILSLPSLCFHSRARVLIPAFLYNVLFFSLPRPLSPPVESLCRSIHRARARAAVIRLPLNARETE